MTEQQRFSLISLGCPKAMIDSEVILGLMVSRGYLLCEEISESDLVIINTCCFIKEAAEESFAVIREAIQAKSRGDVRHVVVYGCASERYGGNLGKRFPEVDAVVGLESRGELPTICSSLFGTAGAVRRSQSKDSCDIEEKETRLRITPRHYAYLKISEGCNNRCTYCTIPTIRGPLRSRSIDVIVAEAEDLAGDGAVELNLVAQDTAAFGIDRAGSSELPKLLHNLSGVEGIRWVRVLYAHPAHITMETIEAIVRTEKVVHYIDMPIQHVSNSILEKMGRGTDKTHLLDLISMMRRMVEDLVIRTTVIVGFPGESDNDFEELLEFIREVRLDRMGVFKYSSEEGTLAYNLPGQVPQELISERYERLMETQQEIAFESNRKFVGKKTQVIVDGKSGRDDLPSVGRTYGDAPEIDNNVFFSDGSLTPGSIFDAAILAADGYDLIGRRVAP